MPENASYYLNGSGELVCVAHDGSGGWVFRAGKWNPDPHVVVAAEGHSSASMHYADISRGEAIQRFPEAFKVNQP